MAQHGVEVAVGTEGPRRLITDRCVGAVSRLCIDDSGELIHITLRDAHERTSMTRGCTRQGSTTVHEVTGGIEDHRGQSQTAVWGLLGMCIG